MLAHSLTKAGLAWSIAPGVARTARGTEFQCLVVSIALEDGRTIQTKPSFFTVTDIDDLLVNTMRRHAPEHPIYLAWARQQGDEPVKLSRSAMADIEGAVATALRKRAVGPTSVIAWTALRHLHPHDYKVLMAAIKESMHALTLAGSHTRLEYGNELREAVTTALEDLHSTKPLKAGRPAERSPEQTFALRALSSSCELTERAEWVFGWAGFFFTDDAKDAVRPKRAAAEPA